MARYGSGLEATLAMTDSLAAAGRCATEWAPLGSSVTEFARQSEHGASDRSGSRNHARHARLPWNPSTCPNALRLHRGRRDAGGLPSRFPNCFPPSGRAALEEAKHLLLARVRMRLLIDERIDRLPGNPLPPNCRSCCCAGSKSAGRWWNRTEMPYGACLDPDPVPFLSTS